MRRNFALIVSTVFAFGLVFAENLLATRLAVDLPERLSNREFWALSVALSEQGEAFISDNLVSNELSFAQTVPELTALPPSSGVYLGVGPEQNFTFLAAMNARIGFIVDIRRENLLLHLMYKALFDLSPTRAAFVAPLLSRESCHP